MLVYHLYLLHATLSSMYVMAYYITMLSIRHKSLQRHKEIQSVWSNLSNQGPPWRLVREVLHFNSDKVKAMTYRRNNLDNLVWCLSLVEYSKDWPVQEQDNVSGIKIMTNRQPKQTTNWIANLLLFQWKSPPIVYVIYRVLIALCSTAWLALTGTGSDRSQVTWFIYVTNWTALVLTFSLLLQAVTAIHCYITVIRRGQGKQTNFTVLTQSVVFI